MIVIIDNYDSFVHNLARYVREAGSKTLVVRNDAMGPEAVLELQPDGVMISPGPKTPAEAGISKALIEAMPHALPLLGVCLGHQCLVEVFGGQTLTAPSPLHGEASDIRHCGQGIFTGVPSPTPAGRYHSLIAQLGDNSALTATAWTADGTVMAVNHVERPLFGVQFHPESLLTVMGRRMISNFVELCREEEKQ